jgi:hypothetical protein
MRRLPALVLSIAFVVVAGCTSERLLPPPSTTPGPEASVAASTTISSTPDPAATATPLPTPEPFPLLSIETKGGECSTGLCTRLVNIEGDGRLHEVIPKDQVIGVVPAPLLDALHVEIEQANYPLILSRPFTGTCPTAYDGQQVIYTFHVSTGDRTVDACKVAIDPNHPLFAATDAAVRAAGG